MTYSCRIDAAEQAAGARFTARSGHSVVHAGGLVCVFGGMLKDSTNKTNEVWWISKDRMVWHLQPTRGDIPPARDGHCAIFDPLSNRYGSSFAEV